MSSVFSRVRVKVEDTISPRVVQPSERSTERSWASSSAVIRTSELTRECCNRHFFTNEIRNCFPDDPKHCLAGLLGEHGYTARRCCCRLITFSFLPTSGGARFLPKYWEIHFF